MSDASKTEPVFKDYAYSGPVQAVCLKASGADGKATPFLDEVLHPGKTYTLLEGHPVVEGWKAMKLIEAKGVSNG